MTRKGTWGLVVVALSLVGRVATGAPPAAAEFAKERAKLDTKLEALRRILPDGPESETDLRHLYLLASKGSLAGAEFRPRPPIEAGSEAYVPVDVSGRGTYLQIHVFFDRINRLPRLVVIERLNLSGVDGGQLQFTGVLQLRYWPKAAPLPPALERRFGDASPAAIEAYRRDAALYGAKVGVVERLRNRNPLRLLAAFDGARVALTEVVLGEEFQFRGSRLLPGPHVYDEELKRLGAEVTWRDHTREGACQSFVLRGRDLGHSSADDLVADRTWLFEPVDRLCGVAQRPGPARMDEKRSLTLDDGTTFSFELMRSAGQAPPDLVSSAVMEGRGVAHRVLADSKRRFFGYTVKAAELGEGRFRLIVGPLPDEARRHLEADFGKLVGDPLAIEYPVPQVVTEDEPLLLELMVNRTTGEKLCDVIRVSSSRPEPKE